MDKTYVITEIKGTFDSNYPDSKKYVFRVGEYDHDVSAFSKFPMSEKQEIFGHIEVKGNYHNFKWGKKGGGASTPSKSSDEVLAALRTTYAEARAANVNAQKCYAVITDLTRMLLKKGVIELDDVPFPTKEDFDKYGT